MSGKKIIVLSGFAISSGFLYWSFKDVSFNQTWLRIQEANGYFLVAGIGCMLVEFGLRAIRWKFLLKPIKVAKTNELFSVLMIGYFSNNIFPARLGELVRAQFLGTNYNVNRVQALATIVVERVCDVLMLLIVFGLCVVFYYPFPDWILRGGFIAGALLLVALAVLYAYRHRRAVFIARMRVGASDNWYLQRFANALENFGAGLSILTDLKNIIMVISTSVLIWVALIASINMVLLAFPLNLSFFAAGIVAVMLGLGMLVPSSPGYIGVYEGFAILALIPFGVEKNVALGFALVLHFIELAVTTSIGFACFMREVGSLGDGAARLWPGPAK